MDEKDLTIKDLCARIPYGVMVHVHIDKDCIDAHNHIHSDYDRTLDTECFNWYVGLDGVTLKPYLRPMEDMDKNEKSDYQYITEQWMYDAEHTISESIDWLNERHFDHRGLIGKGLAIEAPKEMYKNKLKL